MCSFFRMLLFLVIILCSSSVVFCQVPSDDLVSGQLELQLEEKKEGQFEISQNLAINYFREVRALAGKLKQGVSSGPAELTDEDRHKIFDYVSAAYLYCVIRNGKCPLILDAILESDLVHAKLTSGNSCLNMESFWNSWRENDFERRQNYNLSTGRMVIAADFAKKELSRYINCRATVESELKSSPESSRFFKLRYDDQTGNLRNLAKMVRFLELLKEQVGNVFVAVGAREG